MRRLIALLLVSAFLVVLIAPAAYAGHRTATNVALGLASFAVFSQLIAPVLHPRPVYATPVCIAAPPVPVVYATPPHLLILQSRLRLQPRRPSSTPAAGTSFGATA